MGILEKLKLTIFGTPAARAEICYKIGMQDLKKGKKEYAEFNFNSALKLVPNSSKYLMAIGNIRLLKGDIEGAITAFKNASQTSDASATAFSNLGIALRIAGRLSEAREAHEHAVTLGPSDADTLLNASVTFFDLGENDHGLELINRILQIAPDHPGANMRLAILEGSKVGREIFMNRLDHAAEDDSIRASALLMKGDYLIKVGEHKVGEELVLDALKCDSSLCACIEESNEYADLKKSKVFESFMSSMAETMYSTMIQAKRVDSTSSGDNAKNRNLVILSKGRTKAQAKKRAIEALNTEGWSGFVIPEMLLADQRSLNGLRKEVRAAWEMADKNGCHILVFND